ncbi:hypothetical protein ACWC5I_01920 [Kitasatospora sp. NPDC001574]
MSTITTLTTTLRLAGAAITIETPAGRRGAQAAHTRAVHGKLNALWAEAGEARVHAAEEAYAVAEAVTAEQRKAEWEAWNAGELEHRTLPSVHAAAGELQAAMKVAGKRVALRSPGAPVSIGPDPRKVPKPGKTASKGAGWQRWTEADGTERYGIASAASAREAGVGSNPDSRLVVPADGGEPFGIHRTGSGVGSDWARDGDGVPMVPARLQDCSPGLIVGNTALAA